MDAFYFSSATSQNGTNGGKKGSGGRKGTLRIAEANDSPKETTEVMEEMTKINPGTSLANQHHQIMNTCLNNGNEEKAKLLELAPPSEVISAKMRKSSMSCLETTF